MTYDAFAKLSIAAIGFLLLLLTLPVLHYSQESTEYLLYYDSWRITERLRTEAPVSQYLFHNGHTFTVPSAVFWFDTQFGSGNLRLLHGTVFVMQFVIVGLLLSMLRRRSGLGLGNIGATASAAIFLALWLSNSNQVTFLYPMVDVMASVCLLSALAFALLLAELLQGTHSAARQTLLFLIAVLVVTLGFLSLETFVFVLLLGVLECCIRKKWSLSILLILLTLAYLLFYLIHFSLALNYLPSASAIDFELLVSNSLKQLSGHMFHLLNEQGLSFSLAGPLAVTYSLVQVLIIFLSLRLFYRSRYDLRLHQRFAMYAISFAVVSIVSAVWVRFPAAPDLPPVPRYSWFAVIFNWACLLLALDLARSDTILVRSCAKAFIGMNVLFLLLDFGVSHAGKEIIDSRGEMAVYALSPGDEKHLGPAGAARGKVLRGVQYQYLRENQLSVFSHEALSFIGRPLTEFSRREGRCKILAESRSARDVNSVLSMELTGDFDVASGYFLLIGQDEVAKSFSFVGQPKYRDGKYTALFSVTNDNENPTIIYLEKHANEYVLCAG
jgi:hypothetical protein